VVPSSRLPSEQRQAEIRARGRERQAARDRKARYHQNQSDKAIRKFYGFKNSEHRLFEKATTAFSTFARIQYLGAKRWIDVPVSFQLSRAKH
jgi:hypothetical protein